ncbi:MAG: hypothetical protein R2851_17045 [Caldilineaceae bacterium]
MSRPIARCCLLSDPGAGLAGGRAVDGFGRHNVRGAAGEPESTFVRSGVSTAALSKIFWIFNFLGIGSQTEVAQALGRGRTRARRAPWRRWHHLQHRLRAGADRHRHGAGRRIINRALGATATVEQGAVVYMRWRLLGAAVLILLSAFGVLRSQQDMRTPLWIALGLSTVNIRLGALLITGVGPLPALGICRCSHGQRRSPVAGCAGALWMVITRLGWPAQLRLAEASGLMRIGGDLFLRTGHSTSSSCGYASHFTDRPPSGA